MWADRVSLFPHGQGLVEGRKACGRGSGGQHVKYHSVERAVDGVQDDVWPAGSRVAGRSGSLGATARGFANFGETGGREGWRGGDGVEGYMRQRSVAVRRQC